MSASPIDGYRYRFKNEQETPDDSQICWKILSRPLTSFFLKHKKSTKGRTKIIRTPFDYCGCQVGLGTFRFFLNRFVQERGPSSKSFHSCSFFIVPFSFHSVAFRSELKNGLPIPFRSWFSYLKNGSIPLVPFLVKERFHSPRSVLGIKLYSQL